jgi:WD40 repeat protein
MVGGAVSLAVMLSVSHAAAEQSYVVSSNNGALKRYSLDGEFLGNIIDEGNGLLGGPQHMALFGDEILVAGYGNSKISAVDIGTGEVTRQWSMPGLLQPAFLRMDPTGDELWVSFLNSNRVVRFDPMTGEALGDLFAENLIASPHGIDVLSDGSYLVTSSDDRIYRVTDANTKEAVAYLPNAFGRPLNTEVLSDGDTVVVTNYVANSGQSLQSFSLSSGVVSGAFSDVQGIQGDGLIRGHDNNLYAVFYGSGSVGRYGEDGTFQGYLVAPQTGLEQANAVLLIPAPSALAALPAIFGIGFARRRQR